MTAAPRPLLGTALLLLLAGLAGGLLFERAFAGPGTAAPAAPQATVASARDLSGVFRDVARQVGPAVVSVQVQELGPPEGNGAQRLGSGVILRPDGLAVTNDHVVRDSLSITCVLSDGRRREAHLLGTDPDSDLAVLDIEGDGYVSAPIEADQEPEIGDWVLAIGNPQGLSHSVTAGIISARGRCDLDLATYEDFLQTDAAINPGNSGGPLVDLDGRVVGINTAMGTVATGGNGLGFAIPGHMVRFVVDGILKEGHVRRGFLGVTMGSVAPFVARSLGFDRGGLVRVREVQPNSPAARVGLCQDDLILGVAGQDVFDPKQVMNRIAEIGPGGQLQLRIEREGKVSEVSVLLDERGAARLASAP